jgi:hypothetical protein
MGRKRGSINSIINFFKKKTELSFIIIMIFIGITIKFILLPIIISILGTPIPIAIVESCSMHLDKENLSIIVDNDIYKNFSIYPEDIEDWKFKNGLNKGDLIIVTRPTNLEIGDVIIFNSGGGVSKPVIHRIISLENGVTTKGDNNEKSLAFEENFSKKEIYGKAKIRIPFIGWIKLIFFDWQNLPQDRGFCNN